MEATKATTKIVQTASLLLHPQLTFVRNTLETLLVQSGYPGVPNDVLMLENVQDLMSKHPLMLIIYIIETLQSALNSTDILNPTLNVDPVAIRDVYAATFMFHHNFHAFQTLVDATSPAVEIPSDFTFPTSSESTPKNGGSSIKRPLDTTCDDDMIQEITLPRLPGTYRGLPCP